MHIKFDMHASAVERVTAITNELVGSIRRVDLAPKPKQFLSDRPKHVISRERMIEEPILGFTDKSGEFVARFFPFFGKIYGIVPDEYVRLKQAADLLMKIEWISSCLGPKFIEEQLFRWCMERFLGKSKQAFCAWLIDLAKEEINENEVIIPCSFLEMERPMKIGDAEIFPISRGFLDAMETNCLEKAGKHRDDVLALFAKIKADFQGLAGIRLSVVAQPAWAKVQAINIADQIVAMLRLYSAATIDHRVFCPVSLAGSEYAPQTKVLSLRGQEGFSYTMSNARGAEFWRLSSDEASEIESTGWADLGKLISATKLNEFQKKLKTCLLSYSRGITFPDIGDRIVYIMSSLEGMLLKDSSEPIQQNLGDRRPLRFRKTRPKGD